MERLHCPGCGAPIDELGSGTTRQCPYCKATFVVPEDLRGATGAKAAAVAGSVFQDDFTNPKSGWELDDDSEGKQEYTPRGYRIRLGPDEWESYAWNAQVGLDDGSAEVEVTKTSGPDDAWFGLLVRAGDDGCYCFCYDATGWYGIYGYDEDEEDYTIAEANEVGMVRLGNATNQVRVVCQGKRLELHLNGKLALAARNGDFDDGSVELCIGREEDEDDTLDVLFNKLVVRGT